MKQKLSWWVPAGLIALSIVPVVAGAARMAGLAGGGQIAPANARFFASPGPVALHIVSATVFSLLGALQFAPRGPKMSAWHRRAGWLALPAGVIVALSGLWMTVFYPRAEGDGAILDVLRFVFGSGMLVSMVLGFVSILKRDFAQHGAWMTRGYAIGMGAGTQVLTHLPWVLVLGMPGVSTRTFLMGAAWVINLVVAEWWIRRSARVDRDRPRLAQALRGVVGQR